MDYLHLFNEVIKVVTPLNTNKAVATSLDQPLSETGLDSLDLLMMGIYLAEIFGVDEEIAKQMQPKTVGEMIDFVLLHKTTEPTCIDEAIEKIL